MLIGQGQRKIGDPHLVVVFLLVEIWSRGRVRSEGVFPVQVQSQNIEQWHNLCVKSDYPSCIYTHVNSMKKTQAILSSNSLLVVSI